MPQIAFLFPGQGAQEVGMGRQLCESLPAARQMFDEAAEVLGYDLAQVCWNGPPERLNSTAVSQPAIFVSSLCALVSLKATQPDVVASCAGAAGLSLGEYTALVFAGALSFRDGLRVVQKRGEAMQAASDANPGAMVAVLGPDESAVRDLCTRARGNDVLELANYLCPANIVLSGGKAACDAVERLAESAGGRTVRLAVAGAFHTVLMKPADAALARALAGVEIAPPRVPVWSNVDAAPHTDPAEIRGLLVRQVLEPVLWEKTLRNLLAAGLDRFYEIGPGRRVLAGLLKRVQRRAECYNIPA
ncbi:MAG TPA: ACP S-malonyltransferase [Gemmataceae bacterium]|nr:ACP S-malonyltransferase [Gemmataceae bacterium]